MLFFRCSGTIILLKHYASAYQRKARQVFLPHCTPAQRRRKSRKVQSDPSTIRYIMRPVRPQQIEADLRNFEPFWVNESDLPSGYVDAKQLALLVTKLKLAEARRMKGCVLCDKQLAVCSRSKAILAEFGGSCPYPEGTEREVRKTLLVRWPSGRSNHRSVSRDVGGQAPAFCARRALPRHTAFTPLYIRENLQVFRWTTLSCRRKTRRERTRKHPD